MSLALTSPTSQLRGRMGPDAAARLMRSLGDSAAPLWSELTPAEARVITERMNDLPTDNPGADRDALEAFLRDAAVTRADAPGGTQVVTAGAEPNGLWARLDEAQAPTLAAVMGRESPQVAAWMASQLDPKLAAAVLRMLDEDQSLSILQRLLNAEALPGEVAKVIEASLSDTLDRVATEKTGQGHARIARIFDQLGPRHEQSLLAALDAKSPGAGEKVRAQMFTFNDLVGLTAAGMQTLLMSVDRSVLTLALKGAREDVANAFYSNLTRRAGMMIREDMAGFGAIRRSEIEAARSEIVDTARMMIRSGQIRLTDQGDADDDELVE